MSMKLKTLLNPQAEEYLPLPPPPPPPPMPLLSPIIRPQLLLLSAPPPQQLVVPLQPHYTHYLPNAADAAPPPGCTENTEAASPPSVKSPKCPRPPILKNGPKTRRHHLPPRMLKPLGARAQAQPPPKQEWRPKVAGNTSGATDSSPPTMTTLMIKNIPNQLRREFMLKFLDNYCKTHSVAYDFFYLPIDFKNPDNGNFGYAFVNFTTAAAAIKMKKILNKYKWRRDIFHSRKICEMKWATVQGKEALVRRFEKSRFKCKEEEFLPVVLDPPRNGSDPNPPPPVILGKLRLRPAH